MSPLILALFSDRGIDRVWRERGMNCFGAHRCRPACHRHGCGWVRLQERPNWRFIG